MRDQQHRTILCSIECDICGISRLDASIARQATRHFISEASTKTFITAYAHPTAIRSSCPALCSRKREQAPELSRKAHQRSSEQKAVHENFLGYTLLHRYTITPIWCDFSGMTARVVKAKAALRAGITGLRLKNGSYLAVMFTAH